MFFLNSHIDVFYNYGCQYYASSVQRKRTKAKHLRNKNEQCMTRHLRPGLATFARWRYQYVAAFLV